MSRLATAMLLCVLGICLACAPQRMTPEPTPTASAADPVTLLAPGQTARVSGGVFGADWHEGQVVRIGTPDGNPCWGVSTGRIEGGMRVGALRAEHTMEVLIDGSWRPVDLKTILARPDCRD